MITKEAIEAAKKAAPQFWRETDNFERNVSKILTAAFAAMPGASVMEEIMSVSSADHEEAHELLKSLTGAEGGTQQVDWYGLRDKIAAGIAKAKYDQRQIDRHILPALTPAPDLAAENERLRAALETIARRASVTFDIACAALEDRT